MSGSSIEELNELQSRVMIAELIRCGADHFVIAPGSRSTPLVLAISEDPMAKTTVHFDERSAGFYAYGLAKATRKPVCVIVTSGTAVANLYPAVAEAEKDCVPLIIITADRPPELQDCHANQTMRQTNFFQSIVKDHINLEPPSDKVFMKSLTRKIDQLCYQAMKSPMGPVHINVMIREPFFSPTRQVHPAAYLHPTPQTRYLMSESRLPEESLDFLASQFSEIEKGLLIVGDLPNDEKLEPILSLAMKLQWPIFADAGSGLRSMGRDTTLIPFYNQILQATFSKEKMVPELILYFGGTIVSKSLSAWATSTACKQFIHVHDSPLSYDSMHAVTSHIEMKAGFFSELLLPKVYARAPSYWLSLWKEYSLHTEEILEEIFEQDPKLSEPFPVFSMIKQPLYDIDLFFSNSLAIRYADSFLFPKQETGWIFSKRGLSGIDGILSTAIGIAEGRKKPLITVIGDTAFLCDLNALATLKKRNLPITLILLNNNGGGIFQFLPISQKKKECNEYWINSHDYIFDKHAAAFDIPYFSPQSALEYEKIMDQDLEMRGPCIIEIQTDPEENLRFHQEIDAHLKKRMTRGKKEMQLSYFALGKTQ